jgi:predicted nucleic acid-binding protein
MITENTWMKNMGDRPSVLVDINVILDVLQKREPFYQVSASLLALLETGQANGYIAAHSVTTLYYLLQKGKNAAEARATITSLLQFLKIAPVDQETIEQALNLEYRDFEDAIQMICAMRCKADFLITRNVKDFQPALLPVLQPVEFLATM